jgi:hypothetical protein
MENQNNELQLNASAVEFLRESAKWSKFLAIIGFVGIGLMVLAGIFMGTVMSFLPMGNTSSETVPFGIISFLYIIMAALYFFPVYYLFKYATGIKNALNAKNNDLLADGFSYLKSHHKFLGIMMIVLLSLYAIILVGVVVSGVFMASAL